MLYIITPNFKIIVTPLTGAIIKFTFKGKVAFDFRGSTTSEVVITKLQNVLENKTTREEFPLWAYKWVQNFDKRDQLTAEENKLHDYLIELLAIDLEIDKDIYFHPNDDIKDWIQKINDGESF